MKFSGGEEFSFVTKKRFFPPNLNENIPPLRVQIHEGRGGEEEFFFVFMHKKAFFYCK